LIRRKQLLDPVREECFGQVMQSAWPLTGLGVRWRRSKPLRIRLRTTTNTCRAEQPAAAKALGPAGAEMGPSTPSLSGDSRDSPVLDLQSLRDIAHDTGGPALALGFLSDFFSLQQVRLSRLLAALAAEEPTASADAVLSLQTASSMAGATHIAERCATILPLVAARNFTSARVEVAALKRDVDALTAASPVLLEQAAARLGAKLAAHAQA